MLQPLAMALSIALAVPLIHPPTGHAASVKVVATLPILKEFAEQVGREHVEVHSLITGLESEHSYSPKPSDLRSLGEAQLLLEVGLGLEVWVGGLVKNAANPQLRVITTSQGADRRPPRSIGPADQGQQDQGHRLRAAVESEDRGGARRRDRRPGRGPLPAPWDNPGHRFLPIVTGIQRLATDRRPAIVGRDPCRIPIRRIPIPIRRIPIPITPTTSTANP